MFTDYLIKIVWVETLAFALKFALMLIKFFWVAKYYRNSYMKFLPEDPTIDDAGIPFFKIHSKDGT
jgi:hypothetical protein